MTITNIMNGGFFSRNKGMVLKGKYKFKDVVKNTRKSEMNLMNTYEDMDNKIKKYNKAYSIHLDNIKVLDDYLNFNGIETLFKKVIMVDNFVKGHIDKENPLLFNNYKIIGEILPSDMRKEHLLAQVRYIMNKSISGSDQTFIKELTISDISKKEFVLVVVTIDNVKDKKIISHDDYIVNKTETKTAINTIVSHTKKKLKRSSIIAEFKNGDNKSLKSSTKNENNNNTLKINTSKKTKTKSKNKDSKNKDSKNKDSKNKESKNKDSKNKESKNKESKKESIITNKMDEYMSDFAKIRRDEKRKADKQKADEEAKEKAKDQKPNNRKGGILNQDFKSPIQTGIQPGIQPGYQNNNERCKIHRDYQTCKANSCWWDTPTQACGKRPERRNPQYNPNPGQYPPQYNPNQGQYPPANPGQNLFAEQYKAPEKLF